MVFRHLSTFCVVYVAAIVCSSVATRLLYIAVYTSVFMFKGYCLLFILR